MRIGLISDTHDRGEAMAAAIEMLRARGAAFLIHCGDVGSPDMLDHLLGIPSAFVWGNCDYDRSGLERYAKALEVACYQAFGDLTLDGKRIALIHGDDARLKQQLLAGQEYDYLFQGHTHVPEDRRVGRTRLINPGALHRANPKTAALLDTATDRLEMLTVVAPRS